MRTNCLTNQMTVNGENSAERDQKFIHLWEDLLWVRAQKFDLNPICKYEKLKACNGREGRRTGKSMQ